MDLSNQVDRHNNNNRTMHVITSSEVWDGIKIAHHDAHNIIMLTGVRLHGNPRSLNRVGNPENVWCIDLDISGVPISHFMRYYTLRIPLFVIGV